MDWTPDSLTWSVDGTAHRTVYRNTTWNETSNSYHYPQTPARVQLSLWPAGLASNGQGTVDWAGGLVDWDSDDIKNNGYYYAMVKDVNVECYDPPQGATVNGKTSYTYSNAVGTNNTVVIGDDKTVLKSLLGTGTNMSADYPSASGTASAAAATSEVATIPGLSGAGPGTNGQRGQDSSSSASGSQPSGSSSSGSAPKSQQSGYHGFSQGDGTSQAPSPKGEKVMHGSLLAVLVAFIGMLVL